IVGSEQVHRTPTLVEANLTSDIRRVARVVIVLIERTPNVYAVGGSQVITNCMDAGVIADVDVLAGKRTVPKGRLDTHVETAKFNEGVTNCYAVTVPS